MRSRIYSSKFYPPEYFSLIISKPNDIFYDLEKSNAERIAHQKERKEIKKKIEDVQHVLVSYADSSETLSRQCKVSIVKVIGDGVRFESIPKEERVITEKISGTRRPKTTVFSVIYENGTKRDIEVLNGSYLFRFLMRQCRKL